LSQGLGDTNTAPRFALYVAVFVSPSPWLFGYGVVFGCNHRFLCGD